MVFGKQQQTAQCQSHWFTKQLEPMEASDGGK